MTDEELLIFIEARIKSVWAVEQMLVLMREPARAWELGELVRETRSSSTAVGEALSSLKDAGMVDQSTDGTYRFAPKSDDLRTAAEALLETYVERPRFVIRAIFAAPKDNLKIFADAFRLKK